MFIVSWDRQNNHEYCSIFTMLNVYLVRRNYEIPETKWQNNPRKHKRHNSLFWQKKIASLYNRFSATRNRIPEKWRAQRHGRETPPRLAAYFSKHKTSKVTELRLMCAKSEKCEGSRIVSYVVSSRFVGTDHKRPKQSYYI
jgi:hypothetical protein